jgi:hypothetical protein
MIMIGDDEIIARSLVFAGEQQMRVRYNDLVAAAAGGNILADMKVEFRVGYTLMEISREIHWRSPKEAITPGSDFAVTSCGGGWLSEAVGGKTRVVDGPLARLQCWMRSTQTRNISPAQKNKITNKLQTKGNHGRKNL